MIDYRTAIGLQQEKLRQAAHTARKASASPRSRWATRLLRALAKVSKPRSSQHPEDRNESGKLAAPKGVIL